jgi:F0F1-type ATP synthase epsilon subunit
MLVVVMVPRRVIYRGNVSEVILPGEDGEFSVWDYHQPCLYRLRKGNVRIRGEWAEESKAFKAASKANEMRISIKRGIAKMLHNELVVLAETIDVGKAPKGT